jgi:antitoxin YefM
MRTLTVTEARQSIYQLVDEVEREHHPIHISGKRGNAILVAESDWNAMLETLYLIGIPGMRESIIEGLNTPLSQCDENIDW